MIEQLYRRRFYVKRVEHLFGKHANEYAEKLKSSGYVKQGIVAKLKVVGDFAEWTTSSKLTLANLREAKIQEFISTREKSGDRETISNFVEILRREKVILDFPRFRRAVCYAA